jgi:hypothetical protein
MPIDTHPRHQQEQPKRKKGPSPEEVTRQQKEDAEKATKQSRELVAKKAASLPMQPDNRSDIEKYIDGIAPTQIAGSLVRFTKEGRFIVVDTEEEISDDREFICLADETLCGWIRFSEEEDAPPTRIQGLLYRGFKMPLREELGDMDERQWPKGLDGRTPSDPWLHQILVVFQEVKTSALVTFSTTSITGRRACGGLLSHFNRLRKDDPDAYPIVKMKPSGYTSKKFGWVNVPSFAIVGRTSKTPSATPDTSVAGDLQDEIPFLDR